MPVNGMSVGKDYGYGYFDFNTQSMIDLGDVQNVSMTAQKHTISTSPYNAPTRRGFISDGWSIRGTITRTNSNLEDFQLDAIERFEEGLEDKPGYFNETVRDSGLVVRRYQYVQFVFWIDDIGTISRDQTVKITFEGFASSKKRIA